MVDPALIAKRLTRALKRDAARLVYRALAPSRFVVRLPADFVSQWQYLLPRLEQELLEHLAGQIRRLGLETGGSELKVSLRADAELGPAQVGVESFFERPPQSTARLLALAGLEPGLDFPLIKPVTLIGRGQVDLALPGSGISRRHARILGPAGGYLIQDLNSASGTFVNRRPVSEQRLGDGDEITIGQVVLGFSLGLPEPSHA